jgi:lysozyme family protein
VRKVGKAWANNELAPEVIPVENAGAKAPIESAKAPPSKAPGDGATGAGGITVIIMQTIEQLKGLGETPLIQNSIVILTIAGAVATIGGLAYRWYAKRQGDELADALDLDVAT